MISFVEQEEAVEPDYGNRGKMVILADVWSVVSAALLITGNTVGAGCLVMPELAVGPGFINTAGIFGIAWILNLISGLLIADIAIQQQQQQQTSVSSTSSSTPASFQELALSNLGSPFWGTIVSCISLFVNSCVLSFDLGRVGVVGNAILPLISPHTGSIVWGVGLAALLVSQSSRDLSSVASLCVMALFVSFGALILPGWAAVVSSPILQPGIAPDCVHCMTQLAPIILMSMIFQNIVPVVTKNLNYDKNKTLAALVLGSSIPLVLYLSWIYVCLGGGVDWSGLGMDNPNLATPQDGGLAAMLLTIFSLSTLGGSSLGAGLSLTEEITSLFRIGGNSNNDEIAGWTSKVPVVFASVGLPMAAVVALGCDNMTGALSLAGSLGSPLLYFLLPVLMGYSQRQRQQQQPPLSTAADPSSAPPSSSSLIPSACMPIIGGLSGIFVGQEVITRAAELFMA
jgi:tyrosine-specific transport protein